MCARLVWCITGAASLASFRLPNNTQRTAVLGHTGSGKTHFSAWLLSHMNYDKQPWFIIDIKEDPLLGAIKEAQEIPIDIKKLPREPGLYITHPLPHHREQMEDFMWKIWHKKNAGLYVDESYLVPDGDALRALLVTGRSRKIPMIMVSQRPVQVPRHVFSEADFYSVFHLGDNRDKKTVGEFFPSYYKHQEEHDLPERYSHWYQVSSRAHFVLQPVEDRDTILSRFSTRLGERREWNGFI